MVSAAAKSAPHEEHDEEAHLYREVSAGSRRKPRELERDRRRRQHSCWNHLVVAPLWVSYEANLGTLLRTCDAVGACMAVPATDHYRRALDRGDTLAQRPHIHWVREQKVAWVQRQRSAGTRVVAVELADDAISLTRLEPARERTIVLLGHEHRGIPDEVWLLLDDVVEIPMLGRGASLNVAVAGSLVLFRLAGLA